MSFHHADSNHSRSSRPYLVRALYQWLLDNALTPHIVVDAEQSGVEVPRQFVRNGQIVLNVSPDAVRDFYIEGDTLGFSARFGGVPTRVMVPMSALVAIYARENSVGMVFGHEPVLPPAAASEAAPEKQPQGSAEQGPPATDQKKDQKQGAPAKGKPTLKVIK